MRAFVVLGFFHIGLGKRLQKDLFCVEWDVKPQLIVINAAHTHTHTRLTVHFSGTTRVSRWWRGSVVEHRSLAGELSLSCARPAADG